MSESIEEIVKSYTGATSVVLAAPLQTLWSGYGQIVRAHLAYSADMESVPEHVYRRGVRPATVIVKQVEPPVAGGAHPRGWNTSTSHSRKLESYRVESQWYQNFAAQCDQSCRVAKCYGVSMPADGSVGRCVLVLEDLDLHLPVRRSRLGLMQINACLEWLAHFHAKFLTLENHSLWPVGTYWHLATRADEFDAMSPGPLKAAASALNSRLNDARWQTLVHGDAKLANFCFSENLQSVAAVDFQYVGGGCGIRDVVYFLGSALPGSTCQHHENDILDVYFSNLKVAIESYHPDLEALPVITEWRNLYAIAWTDFSRFLTGWMPEHAKLDAYATHLAERAFQQLELQ